MRLAGRETNLTTAPVVEVVLGGHFLPPCANPNLTTARWLSLPP